LTDAKYTPAEAILVAMYLLTALGFLRRIDRVLGEEHTSLEYLKKEWLRAENKSQLSAF
jgi:hypothetical protein